MRRTVLCCLLLASACGDDGPATPAPDDAAVDGPADAAPSFEGGSIALPGCDYSLTTRRGAEAPRPSQPVVGPRPTPRQVRLGLASDPRTSVVMTWRTGDDQTRVARVRFAAGDGLPAEQLTEARDGVTFLFQGGFSSVPDERVLIHEAHLCGLAPDTAYSYQVGGEGAWSPVYTFRTAPAVVDSSTEVAIAFVGDSRGGYEVWGEVVAALRQRAPDLVLYSGDAVTFGPIQDEWDTFFDRGEALFATAPVIFAHGNHEVNSVVYYAQVALPGDEENFSLDYGFAHLTVLNDTPLEPAVIGGATRDFLAADLAAHADARWKLVMHHRAQWSAAQNHGSAVALQQAWGPVIDQHGVDLVLNGHEHNYERTHPMVGGRVAEGDQRGTVYVVSGGAGADLYDNGSDVWTALSRKVHGAALLRIRRDQLVFEAFEPSGAPIDSFTLTKP
jgi:hypothetical protein